MGIQRHDPRCFTVLREHHLSSGLVVEETAKSVCPHREIKFFDLISYPRSRCCTTRLLVNVQVDEWSDFRIFEVPDRLELPEVNHLYKEAGANEMEFMPPRILTQASMKEFLLGRSTRNDRFTQPV